MNITGGSLSVSTGGVAYTHISDWNVDVGTDQHVLVGPPSGTPLSPLVVQGLPTSAELHGDFSALLPDQIFDPTTNPPSPYSDNIVPAYQVPPSGFFVPLNGTATIGGNVGSPTASVTVNGPGSTWNVAASLTINLTGTLSVTNGGAVNVGHPAGSVFNSGTVLVDSNSSLSISNGSASTGLPDYGGGAYVQTAGTTQVAGTLIAPDGVSITGGTLSGGGTIDGNFINDALLSVSGPGKLTIDGNYTQNADGTLVIDIGGASAFSVLNVNDTAMLGGTAQFDFLNGYVPPPNTAFPFLDAGYLSGDFSNVSFSGINCPGCFFDPFTLTLNTGSEAPTGEPTPSPEPSSLTLAALGMTGLWLAVRRRSRAATTDLR